jgi:hypothetical protein
VLNNGALVDLRAVASVGHLVNLEVRNEGLHLGLADDTLQIPTASKTRTLIDTARASSRGWSESPAWASARPCTGALTYASAEDRPSLGWRTG